jgi:hypothetical protein
MKGPIAASLAVLLATLAIAARDDGLQRTNDLCGDDDRVNAKVGEGRMTSP